MNKTKLQWEKLFSEDRERKTKLVSALSKGGFSMHTNPVIMIARC